MAKKKLTPSQLKKVRRQAGKKAWKTRQKNMRETAIANGFDPAEYISLYYKTLGRKGHKALEDKLRRQAEEKDIPFDQYRKRYYSVQGQKARPTYRKRTKKQRQDLPKRKPPATAKPKAYRFADQIHFNVADFNADSIVELVKELKSWGIDLMRFVREVQVGRYQEGDIGVTESGISSTRYFTANQLKNEKEIRRVVGEMLIPGYDYVKELVIKSSELPKMPKPVQARFNRMKILSREEREKKVSTLKSV